METITTRRTGTDSNGSEFNDSIINAIWEKAQFIDKRYYPPNMYRQDKCGNVMEFNHYGNRNIETGWEIDHITPVSKGGTDDLSNLQALTWKNNLMKSDNLYWSCPIKTSW